MVKYRISTLIDTGSDVSIAGENVARRFGWRIVEHETKSVNVANNDPMVVTGNTGATYVTLWVGDRSVESEILIAPDLRGLMLEQQGQFKWDLERGRIKFSDEDWIELRNVQLQTE